MTMPPRVPYTPTDFSGYTPVDVDGYKTYSTYGSKGVQFTTDSGIRCRIDDGPASFQYSAGIACWGPLPGVPHGINLAVVSMFPYDKDTLEPYVHGPVPPGQSVYSLVNHSDLGQLESYLDGSDFTRKPVDPADYHPLAPGQKIGVSGSRDGGDSNQAICAAASDGSLTCELQNIPSGIGTHGFRLSPHDSVLY